MSREADQTGKFIPKLGVFTPLSKNYSITLIVLIILSILNISLKSDRINSNIWSISVDLKVTSLTLLLLVFFWLPILLPWLLAQVPQVQGSLNWLREQGIEEIETNLLRIKLRYGVQEASEKYTEKISNVGATNLPTPAIQQQLEARYQDVITRAEGTIEGEAKEVFKRIDQLAEYYDKIREQMSPGSHRTKLMREISATIWTLMPKITNFPTYERLCSPRAGERLSAYKYLEWQTSTDYMSLLISRSIGILEVPFNQYSALLALRRITTTQQLTAHQSAEIINALKWSANLDYVKHDRQTLMLEIISILEANI